MKRWMTVIAFAFTCNFALGIGLAEAQQPAPAKVLKATGTMSKVDDGEIVLSLILNAQQKAAMLKLPNLESGMPATAGRLGVSKTGEIYVRYILQNSELQKTATENLGRRVNLTLDVDHQVTGIVRAGN